jgi:hypothetical protein
MHYKSLLHVRDHTKVVGTSHHLLEYIAQHTNYHTGEAFELTVERIAHRLHVTSQWVGQLRRQLVETGELIVQQSRGRRPNIYRIPYERYPACQGDNPKPQFGVDDHRDDFNPKVTPAQPQSEPQSVAASTPKCDPANPKVEEMSEPPLARLEPLKEVKDLKDIKEGPTPNSMDPSRHKPEIQSPFWCEAHGFAHGERQPDHRPDCAREREFLLPLGPTAPLRCVGKPGKGQEERECAYHGLTHFREKD